jgi:hypothetical protein
MTKTDTPLDPVPTEDPEFLDVKLKRAWGKYGNAVYVLCALIAAGILGKGIMDYLTAQKELGIERDYAACTTPESFKLFADEHKGHPLAALVELSIADTAYASGKFADAVADYETASADLPAGPFQARAKLGVAISQAQGGRTSDGEAALRQILNDEGQIKAIRCEAGYDLAELAVTAGHPGDVQKLAEQLMQIDPSSPFAERAFALRSTLPASAISTSGIALPVGH